MRFTPPSAGDCARAIVAKAPVKTRETAKAPARARRACLWSILDTRVRFAIMAASHIMRQRGA
jgi:hypothetical protein